MFDDVYEGKMPHIEKQREQLKEHLRLYADKYDLASFKDGEKFPTNWLSKA